MPTSPRILSIGTANPSRRYAQREIYDFAAKHASFYRHASVEQIFMGGDIDYRHFAFDLATLDPHESADQLHARFAEHSLILGKAAVEKCLHNGTLRVEDIDYVVAVTCTGYLCPGLSVLLIKELGLRNDLQRADLVGMGCAGAMPGLQRAFDYVQSHPGRKALVVTVEISSACYYLDDTMETIVGNAICGDGAAAVMVGDQSDGGGPELLDFATLLDTSYINSVGFQFRAGKLRIVLSKDLRTLAGGLAMQTISTLLVRHNLRREEIKHWIIHSGGRKVVDGIKEAAGLTETQLAASRKTLRHYGNMSSPTVLFVLDETIKRSAPAPGDLGLMLAMGPGLALEAALVRW